MFDDMLEGKYSGIVGNMGVAVFKQSIPLGHVKGELARSFVGIIAAGMWFC